MSEKAKELLKKAVKLYREEDGSTEEGSFRDAFTDLLHLLRDNNGRITDVTASRVYNEAYDEFVEECEQAEYAEMERISDKDLPLHIHRLWEFDSVTQEFEKRLKGVKNETDS